MFTGIIEDLGTITHIAKEGQNVHFTIRSNFTDELQVDQSVAHNGVCLTVVSIEDQTYVVTAIQETLEKTNLNNWKVDDQVNLERSVTLQKRMDGHMVQGHVDSIGRIINIEEAEGSWKFTFRVEAKFRNLMVEKGSISVNGTSLTIFNVTDDTFQVAIIPYTFDHTIFHLLSVDDIVNIEFDMMGKYIVQYLERMNEKSTGI